MAKILWIIAAVVLAVWLVGLVMDIAGGLIHLLLIIVVAIVIYNLITGRKAV